MTDQFRGRWSGIDLHIEALVLHGFPAADGNAIAAAVERELAALVKAESDGVWLVRNDRPLNERPFRVGHDAAEGEIGKRVARVIHPLIGLERDK